jgi:hypothetical protein
MPQVPVIVRTHHRQEGDLVLDLLMAFDKAGIKPGQVSQILLNVTKEQMAPYAHTDKVPITIAGKRYVVTERAAAYVGMLDGEWSKLGSHIVDWRQATIVVLNNIIYTWGQGGSVEIRQWKQANLVELRLPTEPPDPMPITVCIYAFGACGLANKLEQLSSTTSLVYTPG